MFLFLMIPVWSLIGFLLGYSLGMIITGVGDVQPRTRNRTPEKGQSSSEEKLSD